MLRGLIHRLSYGVLANASKLACAGFIGFFGAGPASAETVIAALGDSLTQGYGLIEGEGFVPQLQAWMTANGADVRIINAGVSGDTTAGGLARVDWTLTDDIDAMIVALGGNDLLRGLSPDISRANLEGILQKAAAKDVSVLLIGLKAPGNYGPDYKQAFDAIYPDLAARYGTLYAESFLGALQDRPDQAAVLSDLMQRDGIHPNAQGVALIVEALGPEVRKLVQRVE